MIEKSPVWYSSLKSLMDREIKSASEARTKASREIVEGLRNSIDKDTLLRTEVLYWHAHGVVSACERVLEICRNPKLDPEVRISKVLSSLEEELTYDKSRLDRMIVTTMEALRDGESVPRKHQCDWWEAHGGVATLNAAICTIKHREGASHEGHDNG